ncbi:hypothetical protein GCM10011499_21520 [Pelagibacterium lentulum]|uniref:Uncharacterized protein n=2 Tax=Pelagibacterium lentulum TaxID=2029865 RepID=A0A916RF41_9HYPH|nr:hypothetical protein GCM10011499_21520 [Pelagibacterium lentulum]
MAELTTKAERWWWEISFRGRTNMPILLIILLAFLIGTVGFWDALGALIGAVALIGLFWLILAAAVVVGIMWVLRRLR